MDHKEAAEIFSALGDPTRTRIYEFLLDCCCPVAVEESGDVRPVTGMTAGEVCCHVTGSETINSTVSHHLKELRSAGLISMERRGKYMVCSIDRETLGRVADFFDNARKRSGCC